MNILFADACVRGKDVSRTYKLADEFIKRLKSKDENIHIDEINLAKNAPDFYNADNFNDIQAKIAAGQFDNPCFSNALQFAAADRIIIAAPFWEFAFPAVLSAYIENISVSGIAFKYTSEGSVGLCNAEKMLFITTCGQHFSDDEQQKYLIGTNQLRELCKLYGISSFDCFALTGLDAANTDETALMDKALERIREMADEF